MFFHEKTCPGAERGNNCFEGLLPVGSALLKPVGFGHCLPSFPGTCSSGLVVPWPSNLPAMLPPHD